RPDAHGGSRGVRMKAPTKLTKAGKVRGRKPKPVPRYDPDSVDFDFGSDEMARDFRKQMAALDKPWPGKFGYRTATEKIINEELLVADAKRICDAEGHPRTVQNVASIMIQLCGVTDGAGIERLRPSVERWLR